MNPNILQAHDVQVSYNGKPALHKVSMEIPEYSVTALIGPSGCGKSTFLRCLNRMNDLIAGCKVEGEILLDQKNINGNVNLNALRKRVGMVFQKPNPFPMSIFDNVAYGPRTHGEKNKARLEAIVIEALKQASLYEEVKDDLKKSALSLSGGQQQRLCIARALAAEPEILLMDEPTSALDPISTAKIEELCLELKKHYTIIIVTHNLQQAMRIADQTAFFYQGDLIEYADSKTLFTNPAMQKTKDYITGVFG
ncbi:phosphate ABC transporter ATP-binding protein PstB [Erysipelotrichaceae bacterium 51-3]|nr:phosphate ABC transporter ATP-binding protein PstB [Allobaculum sp. JKK-2023]